MTEYLIKVEEGFDISKLTSIGELIYRASLKNIIVLKTNMSLNELLNIIGVIEVEKSKMFKVGFL